MLWDGFVAPDCVVVSPGGPEFLLLQGAIATYPHPRPRLGERREPLVGDDVQ